MSGEGPNMGKDWLRDVGTRLREITQEEPMDYYQIGETAGKAWRLGHMEASEQEMRDFLRDFVKIELTYQAGFTRGFFAGVAAVDASAQQVSRPAGSLSRDVHTFEERIEILEGFVQRYRSLGTDMSFEAFEARSRLEQDVTAYFNPPVEED